MIEIDMEMPTTCGKCRFATAFECIVNREFIPDFDKKSAHCPLTTLDKQKGKWINEHYDGGFWYHTCNKCNSELEVTSTENFCRNCGADMRGGKE